MNGRILALAIVLLMVLGSFGAIGTNSVAEAENDCGCGANSVSTDNGNSVHPLGELRSDDPLPPGEVIDGPATLLTSLDWRNKDGYDWTTPIKNQGNNCGSCYAFGSYGAMDACLDIRDNTPNRNIDLSEQFMVSCGPGWYPGEIMGCNGAYASGTFAFIEDHGAVSESCFPYTSGGGTVPPCNDDCPIIADVDGCGLIQQGSQQSIKNALINYGPVSASFEVYQDFDDYDGGVYVHTYGDFRGNHRVAIVGYNDNPGYWIGKNSWGTGWGDAGWFMIAYGQCGIEDEVYYIDVGEGGNEVTKYGYPADEYGGEWRQWAPHGVELSYETWPWEDAGYTCYYLDIADKSDITDTIQIGVEIKDASASGDGPHVYVWKWASSSWEQVGTTEYEISGTLTWYWRSIAMNNFVTDTGAVRIKVYAESSDDICLDEVGVRYELKPLIPNLDASCSPNPLTWTGAAPSETKTGTITVTNTGEPGSLLDWNVADCPSWVTCSKKSGSDLPKGSSDTITLTVRASDQGQDTRTGTIKIVNSGDSSDYKSFTVTITTKKGRSRVLLFDFYELLQDRIPLLFAILQQIRLQKI